MSPNSQASSGELKSRAISGDAAAPAPAITADSPRLSVKAARTRLLTPRSCSATTAAPTPRSRAASSIATTVSAAVTSPKSSGASSRASTRVSPRITIRLVPQARVVHRNPRTELRPTPSAAGAAGSGPGAPRLERARPGRPRPDRGRHPRCCGFYLHQGFDGWLDSGLELGMARGLNESLRSVGTWAPRLMASSPRQTGRKPPIGRRSTHGGRHQAIVLRRCPMQFPRHRTASIWRGRPDEASRNVATDA